jgi:NAD(P)-dependent dehydrogenase (short-subunit alcohol dehydrogenase family)
MSWSPEQLPSFAGRSAVVTGGNSGIGWHTAAKLAGHGASVTLACRAIAKAERAADRIRAVAPGADVSVEKLDLASQDSIADFTARWERPMDLLVNNAGVMAPPSWTPTIDGFELQFGTNHLGHFALTGRLLPWLLAAEQPRVVTIASLAHRSGGLDVLSGNPASGYHRQRAYANSKLANLLFARELHRRATEHGISLTSTAAHPGLSATGLVADREGFGSNTIVRLAAPFVLRPFCQSAASGANPSLYAASEAAAGSYSGPQRFGETRGPVGAAAVSDVAQDSALGSKLFDVSEQLTGVRFAWR